MKRLFALLMLPCQLYGATTYYVTQNGTSPYNGTQAADWSVANFNDTTKWSATAATPGKISPGDTVVMQGTITSQMNCAGDGLSGQVITVSFETGSIMTGKFSFNGKDYIRMTGMRLADNYKDVAARGSIVTFGGGTSNTSNNCQVDNMYSKSVRGNFIAFGHCRNAIVKDCTFLDFQTMGMTAANNVDGITIENNMMVTATTYATGTPQSQLDLLHLGYASNVTVKGNRLVLRISVAPGTLASNLPHNDIIQSYKNYDTGATARPTNWTIANNWFEIDGVINGGGYSNFGMCQEVTGTWLIYGNLFYSHDLSSATSNGFNWAIHGIDRGSIGKFYNNTFVSLRNGLGQAISAKPNQAGADRDRLEVVNNIFYSDRTQGAPVEQGVSTEPNTGGFVWKNNIIVGWGSAIRNHTPGGSFIGTTKLNTTWGLGGRKSSVAEAGLISTTRDAEDFSLNPSSLALDAGAQLGVAMNLPKSGQRAAFPNAPLGPAGSSIGAVIKGSVLDPPSNLQIVQ
jgi:hypothetical protein